MPCLEMSTLTPHALPFKIKTLTILHASAYDMPVGGSKKKKKFVQWNCLRVAVFRQRGRDSSQGAASHEKSGGAKKKKTA